MSALPPYAAAAERNSVPILAVLEVEFAVCKTVLEIGSGTAQHAVFFAHSMTGLVWQTSDLAESHAGIRKQLASAGLDNVNAPLELDMEAPTAGSRNYDAVYSSNTMHIMSWRAAQNMLAFVASALQKGGVFCYYGPFRRDGHPTTSSNAEFDASLRARNPQMGLRDIESVEQRAAEAGLVRQRVYAMPANNLLLVFRKTADNPVELS